jgi:hypothetical protein
MPEISSKLSRMAAVTVMLMVAFVGSAWAGGRWKVGDVIVCFGSGTCKVVRPGTAPSTTPLDTIGDATTSTPPGPISDPGNTFGVAINNTLHLLVTDAGSSNNKAYVVEYQIAGSDPLGNSVNHGVATVFNSSGVGNIQAVALDNAGDMFILNANQGSPQIAKLDQSGNQQGNAISLSNQCGISQVVSMDLSADGSSAYVTSGGTIQKVNLSNGTCSKFADFGSGVNLFGIRDIPTGAVSNSTGEAILVAAKGFIDPSAGETVEGTGADANDAVNICTNQIDQTAVSCALLLDTTLASGPGLAATTWQAGHLFNPAGITILDPFLQVQTVSTPGTSGTDEPAWSHTTGVLTRDNAVIWTDQGQKLWQPNFIYSVGQIIVDPAGHVQKVTAVRANAVSGSTEPVWSEVCGSTTTDNKVTWTDQCGWLANHFYAAGAMVGSPGAAFPTPTTGRHLELATTPGITGPGPSQPAWSNSTSATIVDGLQWTNGGPSPSVLRRYVVTGQSNLQALALNPLVRDCTVATNCSSNLPSPKVTSFWMADSMSGNFFNLDFAAGTPVEYTINLPSPCTGCQGIQGIGIYGAEDAAQPDLMQLPPVSISPIGSTTTTNPASFDFNPNPTMPGDNSNITITGYNFPNTTPPLALNVYASAINQNSGVSDILSTSAPPPNPPTMAPPTPCTVMTHDGNCVVWQIDNADLPGSGTACTSNTCPFLWVAFSLPTGADPNNVIDVLDEQYDDTYSVDGLPKRACQVSLHTVTPAGQQTGAHCNYVSPLSTNTSQPAACFTTSRNNIPFKFTCTNLPNGSSQASLLPFLRIVQFVPGNNFNPPEEPLLFLQGTGGTTNYRFDTTQQQWVFNLNNPLLGFTPNTSPAEYQACTEDSTRTVETFCTNFYVKNSCP